MSRRPDNESLYLTARNSIAEVILEMLEAQRNGREDIIIMADEATTEILGMFGVTESVMFAKQGK